MGEDPLRPNGGKLMKPVLTRVKRRKLVKLALWDCFYTGSNVLAVTSRVELRTNSGRKDGKHHQAMEKTTANRERGFEEKKLDDINIRTRENNWLEKNYSYKKIQLFWEWMETN